MSCLRFILEVVTKAIQTTNNWAGVAQLENLLDSTQYQNYFTSTQHLQIMEQLTQLTANNIEVTTPYEFLSVVLAQKFRTRVKNVIDFALTIPEIANHSAEETFIGCCLYVSESSPDASFGDQMELKFANAMIGGQQIKALLKEAV